MKATNIYQTLKAQGLKAKSTKPQLPGVASPLKKSPYKFNAGLKKAAAEGKLDSNPKFKDAVESSPAKKYVSDAQRKAVHASKAEKASPAKNKDNGKKPKLISKVTDKKTGITTAKYDVGTNMPKIVKTKKSPVKKKSCGSPVKMDLGVAGPGNPKKAIRKAKRKATKGHKAGVRASNICKRSTRGKGSTYRN